MKLATLKAGGRDGTLVVADRRLERAVAVPEIARTLQAALDGWSEMAPRLQSVYQALNKREVPDASPVNFDEFAAPLPRAYQWLDGSAYLPHVELARRARGAELPPEFRSDPLMYQGCSDVLLGPRDSIVVENEQWGIDFEAELAVITDDVPVGVLASEAAAHIKLLTLVNDISLRRLMPAELAKGFGFVHSKPPSSFAPVAVTPDELGGAWDGAKIHLPLITHMNGDLVGRPDAGTDMHFDFPALIRHAAKTRPLGAGTIIGSGTISNSDRSHGSSCLVERQMLEIIEGGTATTPYMRYRDRVRIEMLDEKGLSIFGAIDQIVQPRPTPKGVG
ncbi:MAG: fumarylacetoacetate hydrolase family protein [Candidatus Binatia bacterium]